MTYYLYPSGERSDGPFEIWYLSEDGTKRDLVGKVEKEEVASAIVAILSSYGATLAEARTFFGMLIVMVATWRAR